jgi:hypothetical protein
MASKALCLALVDKRLAMSEVVRNVNRAIQLCGSAIFSVPTGGRKKKLRTRVAAIDRMEASTNPQMLAITSTTSRNAKPAVVAFT